MIVAVCSCPLENSLCSSNYQLPWKCVVRGSGRVRTGSVRVKTKSRLILIDVGGYFNIVCKVKVFLVNEVCVVFSMVLIRKAQGSSFWPLIKALSREIFVSYGLKWTFSELFQFVRPKNRLYRLIMRHLR